MITIKFPKSPKTPQRRRVQSIGNKYDYIEEDYFSVIKISEINDNLFTILDSIQTWKDNHCYIEDTEIKITYLLQLVECILAKENPSNLKWYYGGCEYYSLTRNYDSFEDLKEALDNESKPKEDEFYRYDFNISWSLRRLIDVEMIKIIIPKKEWRIEKEKIKEEIKYKANLIRKIYLDFNIEKTLEIIDSFPDKILKNSKFNKEKEDGSENLNKIKNLTSEEISNQIVEFMKKEFPNEISNHTIKYEIIPLFWEQKGIKTIRIDSEIRLKLKKAEMMAENAFLNKNIEKIDEIEEESNGYNEIIELLKKIEENTRK